jgi:hypothetical protein
MKRITIGKLKNITRLTTRTSPIIAGVNSGAYEE